MLIGCFARRKDTDMFCPNCGKENPDGVAFCAGCGMAIGSRIAQPAPQPVAAPAPQPVAPQAPQPAVSYAPPEPAPAAAPVIPQPEPAPKSTYNAPTPPPRTDAGTQSSGVSFVQHFKNLFSAAIHPVTGPAEIAGQYNRVGDAIFLAGIAAVLCWLVDFTSWMTVHLIRYANHKNYYDSIGKIIFQDFYRPLINYSILIFGCAGVFMLAGLILKEKWSFSRLLAISAMATAPAFIVSDLFGAYLSLISEYKVRNIFSIITLAATLYYYLMLFEGMSSETKLTGNKKGFVLVICIAIAGYAASILTI